MADVGSSAAASLVEYATRTFAALDRKSYYDLLGVAANADASTIRAAYYKLAAALHPDRYHGLPDRDARTKLESIYARICEAYRVLSTPSKRGQYDKGLASGKLRFDFTAPKDQQTPKNPEDAIKHPEAKKFFRLGMVCLGNKDWKGAVLNFGFARSYEPASALIAEKLAQAQAGQKGGA